MQTIGHYVKNCPAAVISQQGAWRVNGTVVPLYDTLGPDSIADSFYSSNHAENDCSRS